MIKFLYLSILIFIFSCTANIKERITKKESPERFYLRAKIGGSHKDDKFVYFSIITQLINDTKDTINYASNSCLWQDFYIIDKEQLIVNRKLILDEFGCDHDYPQLKTVFPDSPDETKILKFKFKKALNNCII
jgi:hypothetical protein